MERYLVLFALIFVFTFTNKDAFSQDKFVEEFNIVKTEAAQNLRYMKKNILEIAVTIPIGTVVKFPKVNPGVYNDYRDEKGTILRSSTGFFSNVTIVSVVPEKQAIFPLEKISKLNSTVGGLFIIRSVLKETDSAGYFKALIPGPVNTDYLSLFTKDGKSKMAYTKYFMKRFANSLNLAVDQNAMSARDRIKWTSIYEELKIAGNREEKTRSDYLFINIVLANQSTKNFEANGVTRPKGAYTMAVDSTAVRHGFPNVPCAEFMSEMVRQAYNRAGYDFKEDFNNKKGNYLIWNKTAAVVNFANALYVGGWIPWELNKFNPPIGAIMMNEQATSPGHTYMAAGENGRFLIDNGAPAGRDLRKTTKKITAMMFNAGVFFLPPGIIPSKW